MTYIPKIEAYRNQREADLVIRILHAEANCDYNLRDKLKRELAELRSVSEKVEEIEEDDGGEGLVFDKK